jgi:hypothetical protein
VPKFTKAFQNFTAGEITERLHGRTDIAKYDNGGLAHASLPRLRAARMLFA